jgi:hypothetical protein
VSIANRSRGPNRSRTLEACLAVALLPRNLWVWVHAEVLARGGDPAEAPQLGHLRLQQQLDRVAWAVVALMHDGSTPRVVLDREG